MPPDGLEGVALLLRRVIARAAEDARRQPGFGPNHDAILREIDGATTAAELIAGWGRSGANQATSALRDLLAWGACTLAASDPVAAADAVDVDVDREDTGVDVTPDLAARISAAAAMLDEGRVLELLGLSADADRAEIKRAYYLLAKEFHPDRFYGLKLGKYAAMVERVFEAVSQAIKTLVDQRSVVQQTAGSRYQRRRSPRYAYSTELRMRCETWPSVLTLATRQVGAGGMFVATDELANVGERCAFELGLPDRTTIRLSGRIVGRVPVRGDRPAGLCVQFAPLAEQDRQRFTLLIEAARALAPTPIPDDREAPPRLAKGSGGTRAVAPIIGIDLGTTFVSVSAAIGGRVHVLPFPGGARAMPSVVSFPQRGEVLVGEPARERLARDPKHTIASAKRLLGRRADDTEIQGQLANAGYSTLAGPDGELYVDMWHEPIAIPQLCGYLLSAARVTAERALGRPVGSAVLTAPVSFGPERIELLRRAAKLAHIEVLEVVDEPSAAALANRFRPEFGGIVGIYDFGGGTFDFSVVDTANGDFRVLTTAGDSWLGGDDFDVAMADALANLFWKANGVDVRQRAVEWQRVLFAVEKAKRELSQAEETTLVVTDVLTKASGTGDLRSKILRSQAERLWRPLIDRSLHTCRSTLAMIGLHPRDLSAVYLSGGTTHMPLIRRLLHECFGTAPLTGVPPDYAVCLGAGVQAAQLEMMRESTLQNRG